MKKGYTMVRRLKPTPFELRVAIEALNAKRLKQRQAGSITEKLQILFSTCLILLKRNNRIKHEADFMTTN